MGGMSILNPGSLGNYFLWCFDMFVFGLTLYKGMLLPKV